MQTEFEKIRESFFDIVRHPAERWDSLLDQSAATSPEVHRQVAVLLRAHSQRNGILDRDAVASCSATSSENLTEGPGAIIGSYKLLEQIGEGGFGVVFMAEQQQPVRRKVALKILKPGMDTRQIVARFEAERQALALMDHPNIAHIYDGGETASGRPYFVMELVRGTPITDFCHENQTPVRERLRLLASACRAVQHAHQKGIIHRDLKPANVLVTLHDTVPIVKVIDFGIAKATGQQLTDKTLFTNFVQMIGTPMYMSPEQAEMSGLDIDTRSDIYSLGVLLYEVLTGATPFDQERLRTASFDEIRRIIREEEPTRPSAKVSTVAKAATTASARRESNSNKLSQLFRSELDWVVMKCLEKNRDRRYESAAALAEEMERYLCDEPVLTCPPSKWYRLQKFAKRNKVGLTIGALILGFIVLLGGGIGWIAQDRATRQFKATVAVDASLAEARRLQSEGKWRDALAAAKRAEAILGNGELPPNLEEAVRMSLNDLKMVTTLEEVRLLRGYVKDGHFDLEEEDRAYAAAFREYGLDVEMLDAQQAAQSIKERSIRVELTAALDGWAQTRRLVRRETSKSWRDLLQLAQTADSDPKRAAFREAILRNDRQFLVQWAGSDDIKGRPPVTSALCAAYLAETGAIEEAVHLLRETQREYPGDFWINHLLAYCLRHSGHAGPDEVVRFYTAAAAVRPESPGALLNLSGALSEQGRLDEASAICRRIINLKPDYAEAYCNLALNLAREDTFDDALSAVRQAIKLKPNLAEAHHSLGVILQKQDQLDEAIAAYRQAIELRPRQAEFHSSLGAALANNNQLQEAIAVCQRAVEMKVDYPQGYSNLGLALQRAGRFQEAETACRKSIELKPDYPEAHFNLGLTLTSQGRLGDAAVCYRRAIEWRPTYAEAHCNLGVLLGRQAQLDDAITELRRTIELKPKHTLAHHNLGRMLEDKGRFEEAVATYRQVIGLTTNSAKAYYDLGNALRELNRFNEARVAYGQAITFKPDFAEAHCNLGLLQFEEGEFAQALTALQRGHELGSRRPNWPYPSAQWIENCQKLCSLESQLPKIIRGEAKTTSPLELDTFAQVCFYKKHYLPAARLWMKVFNSDTQQLTDTEKSNRYEAACAAARVAASESVDGERLGDEERARWRKQALVWLQANLDDNRKLLESNKREARQILWRVHKWQRDQSFDSVRDPSALAKLPINEQESWKQFWVKTQAFLTEAESAMKADQQNQ